MYSAERHRPRLASGCVRQRSPAQPGVHQTDQPSGLCRGASKASHRPSRAPAHTDRQVRLAPTPAASRPGITHCVVGEARPPGASTSPAERLQHPDKPCHGLRRHRRPLSGRAGRPVPMGGWTPCSRLSGLQERRAQEVGRGSAPPQKPVRICVSACLGTKVQST